MRKQLNEKYFDKLESIFAQNKEKYLSIFDESANYGIRINSLKENDGLILNKLDIEKDKVTWAENGYYIQKDNTLSKNLLYEAGAFYIQEPSAMISATVLEIEEGDIVLDMCAAPGGKSTLIGEKLRGTGALIANDISNSRAKILAKNIEKFGIKNAIVLSDSQDVLEKKFDKFFDKILIDAPCSGEGMFRKEPDVEKYWHENSDIEYQVIQKDLLNSANNMLKDGGELVYSTCTFNKIENENLILEFLQNNKNFILLDIDHKAFGISKGYDIDDSGNFDLSKTGRIFPFEQRGEGHFVARLKKVGSREKTDLGNNHKELDKKEYVELNDFFKNNFKSIRVKDLGNYIVKHKDSYFISPVNPELFKGIRVVRSGFHLGDTSKKFVPSSVLARGVDIEDFKGLINFNINDIEVSKYLKGETIDYEKKYEGYVLISVESLGLGFGIIKNNKIKNKYNKHWFIS